MSSTDGTNGASRPEGVRLRSSGPKRTHERSGMRIRRRLKVMLQYSPSFSVDIGPGGLCLELLRVLPPGAPVEGTIQMQGTALPFSGRVAWSKPGIPHMGLRGKMGVLFTRGAPGWAELLSGRGGPDV